MKKNTIPTYIPKTAQNVCAPGNGNRCWFWQDGGFDHYCVAVVAAGEEAETGFSYTLTAPDTGDRWALIEVGKNGQHVRWIWRSVDD